MNTEFAVGEVFAVWAAYHGADKGYGAKIGTFSTVGKAVQAASGKGWYGVMAMWLSKSRLCPQMARS
jgi:hypothetical protein